MIPGTKKFNDPDGSPEQQHCEHVCGIFDAATGSTERKNRDGESFDVHYLEYEGRLMLANFVDKCMGCPHWQAFKKNFEAQA